MGLTVRVQWQRSRFELPLFGEIGFRAPRGGLPGLQGSGHNGAQREQHLSND